MSETAASAAGLFMAAAVPPALNTLGTLALDGSADLDLPSLLVFTALFYPFSLAAAALFGLPLFLVLRHFALIRWWSAAVSGFAVGAIVALLLRLPSPVQARDLLVCIPEGGLAGLTFWAIWRLGDRGPRTGLLDSGFRRK